MPKQSGERVEITDELLRHSQRWAFGKFRHRVKSDDDWEKVYGYFLLRVCHRWPHFDPARSSAFTFLCMLWRNAYNQYVRRCFDKKGRSIRHDLLDQPRVDEEGRPFLVSLEALHERLSGGIDEA